MFGNLSVDIDRIALAVAAAAVLLMLFAPSVMAGPEDSLRTLKELYKP